jgi:periplasmic divalent cation tolerance protein
MKGNTCHMEKVPPMSHEICVIFSTAPPLEAAKMARVLVEQHLVACVNIAHVSSYYLWKGEFTAENEHLMIAKTRKEKADEVIRAIKAMHPYEVPEIIALPVIAGHAPYLDWVHEETNRP